MSRRVHARAQRDRVAPDLLEVGGRALLGGDRGAGLGERGLAGGHERREDEPAQRAALATFSSSSFATMSSAEVGGLTALSIAATLPSLSM